MSKMTRARPLGVVPKVRVDARLALAITFALLVCVPLGWRPSAAQGASVPATHFTSSFEISTCPFDLPPGVEDDVVFCGFVIVPEDHADPSGSTIRLATAIVRAQGSDRVPDPLILLAGGPGEKTVQNTVALAQALAPLRAHRDLIIFDQRGAGLSQPALECPEVVQVALAMLDERDINVAAQASFEAVVACGNRLVREGNDLSVYTTSQNAADVDAIRVALGYDRVNLYGGSYGSQLAQAVMRDYPSGIRSVFMESIYPLEASLLVESARTVPATVIALIEACNANTECNSAYPNLRATLFEVIDRLNMEPVSITLTHPITGEKFDAVLTGDTLLASLRAMLYVTAALPAVPAAIYDIYNGNYGLIERLSSLRLALLDGISVGMEYSMLCAEDLIGHTFSDFLAARETLPQQLAGTPGPDTLERYGVFAQCNAWPVEEVASDAKAPLVSDIPTLLLSGEFDHVTPPEYGRTVASRLANSFFFVLPAGGHSGENLTPCALAITAAFLDQPTVEPDTSCLSTLPSLVFDLPRAETSVVLKPFEDESRGFAGVIPADWRALDTTNLVRERSALDPSYFVLEATPGTAADLLANLSAQLGMNADMNPVEVADVGEFTWTFFAFERGGNLADLALAEDDNKAYFVFMVSAPDERNILFDTLFMPAVAAIRALP